MAIVMLLFKGYNPDITMCANSATQTTVRIIQTLTAFEKQGSVFFE